MTKFKLIPARITAAVLCALMLFSLFPTAGFAVSDNEEYKAFDDVPDGKWFASPVRYVVEHGYFAGTSAALFSPGAKMTRAMFIAVLAKIAGADLSDFTEKVFDDVGENRYYFAAAGWAYANGIVSGKGERIFAPNVSITRQEVCLMMVKYLAYKGLSCPVAVNGGKFADDGEIAGWAKDAVYEIRGYGIISGKPGNKADPKGTATRAEVATMIMRLDEAQAEAEKDTYTAYVAKPIANLYKDRNDEEPALTLTYMNEVVYLGTEKNYGTGAWVRVRYDDCVYYMWEPNGDQVLSRERIERKYVGANEITQKMLDLAVEMYAWPVRYRHGESNGIPAADGTYGYDCSGLVSYIMDRVMAEYVPTFNVSGSVITLYNTEIEYNGGVKGEFRPLEIRREDIQPGDIIFFNLIDENDIEDPKADFPVTHCGMYLGYGDFIHCTHYNFGPDGLFIMPLDDRYEDSIVCIKRMVPENPVPANETRYVLPFSANVRCGMSVNAEVIDTVFAETEVTLLYTDADFTTGEARWAYVSYGDGKTGFISAANLTDTVTDLEETRYVASAGVKLYEKADTSSPYTEVLCTSTVMYNGVYGNSHFHKVTYEGRDLFLYCSEETDLDSLLTTDLDTLLAGKGRKKLIKASNLRSNMDSSTQDSVIRLLHTGDNVLLIALSREGVWSYVKTENGVFGFVSSAALEDAE